MQMFPGHRECLRRTTRHTGTDRYVHTVRVIIVTCYIIIMNFYSTYVLRNISSEAQQPESLSIFINKNKSHHQNKGPPKIYDGNVIWNKYVLSFSEGS